MTTELVNSYQSLIISIFPKDFIPNSVIKTKPTFTGSQKIAYLELSTIEDAAIKIRNHGRGIIIYGLSHKDSLQEISHFLDSHSKEIEAGLIRVIVFDKFMSERIHRKLASQGAAEILHSTILEKAYLYKIVLNVQLLEKKWVSIHSTSTNKSHKIIDDLKFETLEPSFVTHKVETIWVDALSIDSDCWIVENTSDIKSLADRWVIECIGPSPMNGKWLKIDFKSQYGTSAWKWTPSNPDTDFFVNKSGNWLYFGREPIFHSDIKKWRFSDEKPILAFFYDQNTCLFRFHVDSNKRLVICKNSENALNLKNDLIATLDQYSKTSNSLIDSFKDDDIDWDTPPSLSEVLPSNRQLEINIPGLVSGDEVFKSIGVDIQLWKEDGLWKTNEGVILEHDDTKIIIDSPIQGLKVGDMLRAIINTISVEPPLKCELKARIKSIETFKQDDPRGIITLDIPAQSATELQRIFSKFNSRQNEVFNLFKEIRGY